MREPWARGCPMGSSNGARTGDGTNCAPPGGCDASTVVGLLLVTLGAAVAVTVPGAVAGAWAGVATAVGIAAGTTAGATAAGATGGAATSATCAGGEVEALKAAGEASGGGGMPLILPASNSGGRCGDSIGGLCVLTSFCTSKRGGCCGGAAVSCGESPPGSTAPGATRVTNQLAVLDMGASPAEHGVGAIGVAGMENRCSCPERRPINLPGAEMGCTTC
mmetsp:Transcript_78426/g.196973  ORF Transcript_78426/g.196973 Transcript_78426/m.196973 type:complete len:220 (+) Transcript_78426:364-1023(+)